MANEKTVISFTKPTPQWSKNMFRIVFALTTGITAYVAATNLLPQEAKYELTLVLKLLVDPLVFGISKMFGIDTPDTDKPMPNN